MTFIKQTDKLIIFPFIRLFVLILFVTVFIMLMQFFLIWFDELIGKDLGLWIYLQLFLYFGINATPVAFSLATLVASLMVFGSLGEQLELTALKSVGITFIRILRPLFLLVGLLSLFVYFSNGYLVPKVTVKAHTLLYDLRKKKPSIAIKEGVFYNGLSDYSIRVGRKLPDQKTLEDIIIYDHTNKKGNTHMTAAASGQLTNSLDGRYLIIELFNGYNYLEQQPNKKDKSSSEKLSKPTIPDFYRTSFKAQKILIDLDAFKLTRTSEQYFNYYHSTKTTRDLIKDIVEMKGKLKVTQQVVINNVQQHYQLPALEHPTSSNSGIGTPSKSAVDSTSTDHAAGKSSTVTSAQAHTTSAHVATPTTSSATEDSILSIPFYQPTEHIPPSTHPGSSSSHFLVQEMAQLADFQEIIQQTLRQARKFKHQVETDINQLVDVSPALNQPDSSSPHFLSQELAHRADFQEIIQKTLRQARKFKHQVETDTNQLVDVSPALNQSDSSSPHFLIQELAHRADRREIIQKTLRQARNFKHQVEKDINQLVSISQELKEFQLEQGKRTSYAIACLIMLLIGAPLGALIKKGGLGVPLLISTAFILMYYVVDIFGTKWAKIGFISSTLGSWSANIVLIPFALFFLWQAQKDTRLLDRDAYRLRWRRKNKHTLTAN